MARTVARLPAGSRITDHISLGVIAKAFLQIPVHRGQSFRRIADSIPVIADSF